MKKILIAFAALLGFASCSEDEIELYSGTPMVNFLFLTPNLNTGVLVETTEMPFINFVENPTWTEQRVPYRVSISGVKTDYDRTVYFKYEGDVNFATQTELPKSMVIPANKVIVDTVLIVKRPENADEAKENIIRITTETRDGMMPGVNGKAALDISLFPSQWVCVKPNDATVAKAVLGEPSKVKNKILVEIYGTFVMDPVAGMAPDFNPYKAKMSEYLDNYNADPTKYNSKFGPAPMRDEKGAIVKIG